MTETLDDHLPPPPAPTRPRRGGRGGNDTNETDSPTATSRTISLWGDRILFASLGILFGFAAAYVYLERAQGLSPVAARDPHAGIPGVGPGATRDLPGSGGGTPPLADPAARQGLRDLEASVAREPGKYDLLVKLGNAYYDGDDPRHAAEAYERALTIRADDVNVLTDLGVSYRNLGQVDKALSLFDRAAKLDPSHWQSLFNQAIVFGIDKGDAAKAKEILARLKKQHPEIPALDKLEAVIEERAKAKRGP